MTLLMLGGADGVCGGRSYLCAFPDFTIIEDDPCTAFDQLKARRPSARPVAGSDGFSGGYAGLFGYDLGQAFEAAPSSPPGLAAWPAVAVGWYSAVAVFDHEACSLTVRGATKSVFRSHHAR